MLKEQDPFPYCAGFTIFNRRNRFPPAGIAVESVTHTVLAPVPASETVLLIA